MLTSLIANGTESIADEAYRRIEEMIAFGILPPGSMVSESQLGEELKCGRTPIREALLRLKLEGYVIVHPRRGALVTTIDVRKQLELLEVRRALEDLTVRLAAVRANDDERARMVTLSEEIVQVKDRVGYVRTAKAIQDLCAAATRNARLADTIRVIHGLSRRFWYAYIEDPKRLTQASNLHSRIIKSVAAGNPDRAAANAAALMEFLESLTQLAIERRL